MSNHLLLLCSVVNFIDGAVDFIVYQIVPALCARAFIPIADKTELPFFVYLF